MGISIYNIRRWTAMLTGKSIYHVNQSIGKKIDKESLGGYYNDLTQKVIKGDANLDHGIPVMVHSSGEKIKMPTMIFQYGLGAYDLWLISDKQNKEYLQKVISCADWAVSTQLDNGAWNVFYYIYPDNPYSAMPQGEGASLLLRVYEVTKNKKYYECAKRAIDYMLIPVEKGGVSIYRNQKLLLLEYTHLPVVMNGWIFAIWGLQDLLYFTKDRIYQKAYNDTIETLKEYLPAFDCGYWSMYDLGGMISSPFYHNLHIAQMKALYETTNIILFKEYADKWEKCQKNKLFSCTAFFKKAFQKIAEKEK